MKNLKVSKAAIALSTAVLMTGNIIGPVASASVANKLSLTPNTFDIKPGERLSLSVDYAPSDSGVAGFTISVHFDPQSMDVYVPDEDMSAGSAFALVSNYDNAGSGVITLVGANMAGTNVTEKSNITTLYFDIKDDAEGYLSYWVDVENMVADGSSGYVNADYSAPTESSPLRVGVASKYAETTAVTTTTTSATAAVTEKKEESAKAATTTKAVTTTAAPEEKEEELVELLPEEPEEGEEPKEEKPAVTTTAKAEEKPEETSAAKEETKQEPEEKTEDKPEENGEVLYSYTQDGGDFNSESTVQYVFDLSDYTDDLSGTADIKVSLNTSGSVSGALGFGTNAGEWDSYGNRSDGSTDTVWEAKDVDLSSLNGYAAVQFYYIENGTDISVEDISIEVNGGDEINAEPEESAAAEEAAPAEDTTANETTADEQASTEQTPAAEDNSEETEVAPAEDKSAEMDTQAADEQAADDDTADTDEAAEEGDTAAEDDEAVEEAVPASAEVKPATTEVQTKVETAAAQASANPKTGDSSATTERVRIMLMLISSGVLVYSAIAVLLNKFFSRKSE